MSQSMQRSPRARAADRSPGCGGFALVIALSLMAFILLLLLSLTAFVRVETKSADIQMDNLKARQNALLGLFVALGETQKAMGPDQRVNAPASQGMPPEATAGHRHWTGVFEGRESSGAPDPESRAEPTFRRWLVSASDGAGAEAAWLTDRAEVATEGFDAAVRAGDAVRLAGGGDGEAVVAGKREAGAGGGAYAWWVGDESTKAFVHSSGEGGSDDYGNWKNERISAPVTAYPLIGGLEWLEPSSAPGAKAGGRGALAFADGAPADFSARDSFHKTTPFAHGVMADARSGGLRRDLSFHLETSRENRPMAPLYTAEGLRDKTDVWRHPDDEVGDTEPVDLAGVGFDGLWAYHNLWKFLGGSEGAPVLVSDYDRDIRSPAAYYKAPAIVRAGWTIAVSAEEDNRSGDDGETTAPTKFRSLLRFNPFVTLWNPYNAPMELGEDDELSVSIRGFPYEVEIWFSDVAGDSTSARFGHQWWMASSLSPNGKFGNTGFSVVTMTLDADAFGRLEPGEAVVFSAGGDSGTRYDGRLSEDGNEAGESRRSNKSATLEGERGWTREGGGIVVAGGDKRVISDTTETTFEADQFLHVRVDPIDKVPARIGKDRGRSNSHMYTGFKVRPSGGGPVLSGGFVNSGRYPYGQRPPHRFLDYFPEKFPAIPREGLFHGDKISVATPVGGLPGSWTDVGIVSFEMHTERPLENWPAVPALHLFNPGGQIVQFDSWRDEDLAGNPYRFRTFTFAAANDLSGKMEVESSGHTFFGPSHHESEGGQDNVASYAIPEGPAKSLGDLQNVASHGRGHFTEAQARQRLRGNWKHGNLLGPAAGHIVGNSYAPPVLPPDRVRGHSNPETTGSNDTGTPAVDHSYLANHALWDRWFFSSISPDPSESFGVGRTQREVWNDFLAGEAALPNERMVAAPGARERPLFDGAGEPVADADRTAAANVMVEGAFNVNATDPEVWAAQLAPLRGRSVPVREPGASGLDWRSTEAERAPFPRFPAPIGGEVAKGDLGDAFSPEQWRGYRVLDDEDVRALAEAVAAEVRKRGPFTSLADFVNRRPGGDADDQAKGPLQAALDRTVNPAPSEMGSGRWVREGGGETVAAFPGAREIPKSLGMPGWIYQADVLALLGPTLTARSDTFVVRAYGEADGAPDEASPSKAWAEAIVQRFPPYVDASNPAHTPVDPDEARAVGLEPLTAINRNFGRRFEIVAFRWLTEREL